MFRWHRHGPLNAEIGREFRFKGIHKPGVGLGQFARRHAAAEAVNRLLGCGDHIRMAGQPQVVGAGEIDRLPCLLLPRALTTRAAAPLRIEPIDEVPLNAGHEIVPAVDALQPVRAKPHLVAALNAVHHVVEGNGIDSPGGKGIAQRQPGRIRQPIHFRLHELLDRLMGAGRQLLHADSGLTRLADSGSWRKRRRQVGNA